MHREPGLSFELTSILSGIDGVGDANLAQQPWLLHSWADPPAFYAALWRATLGNRLPQTKSAAFVSYDLYADTVQRHRNDGHAALRWYDPDDGPQVLSYAALHSRAQLLAGLWAAQGVQPGQTVVLLSPPSAALLVALAAALHLGLCISVLPPVGPVALERRLRAFQPDYLAADHGYLPLARALGLRLIPLRNADGAGAPSPRSHSYAAAEPLLRLYAPDSEEGVHVLRASDAVLPALRDGVLLLGLRPGDVLAAPGYALESHLPVLLLITLLCGAALLHLTIPQVQARPQLLMMSPLRSLGITPALRDLLGQGPAGLLRDVQRWFRDPAAPYSRDAWQRLVAHQGLGDIPGSNLYFAERAGGCLLFSSRRRELAHQEVLPAPACALPLLDLSQSGQPAIGKLCVFADHMLLLRATRGYLYGGTLSPRRAGRYFPAPEVCAAAAQLPFVRGAVVVSQPSGEGDHRFVLLLFTGDEGVDGAARAQLQAAALRHLQEVLGEDLLPDHCECYPLFPRQQEGQVDEAWAQSQHLRGLLHRKARHPLFRRLTELRARAVPPLPRRPAGPRPSLSSG